MLQLSLQCCVAVQSLTFTAMRTFGVPGSTAGGTGWAPACTRTQSGRVSCHERTCRVI